MNPNLNSSRTTMNGKPVFAVHAKSVINFESAFRHKLLCDGPTFSTGSACAYSCTFCYVPDLSRKSPHFAGIREPHESVVVRRANAIGILRSQLTDASGQPKFDDFTDTRVIYSSPLVDVAANMELVRETVEACVTILKLTHWQIRLLSKSNLLPQIAQAIPERYKRRMIYGVSTGTLDDRLASAIEQGTPLVSKRIAALHWLQDNGFRTFGMICPSLPQTDYTQYAASMAQALRTDRCEHVWGEIVNVRGASMSRTVAALHRAGFRVEAGQLQAVSQDKALWEQYARNTFEAHAKLYPSGKLRFLQYITPDSRDWWTRQLYRGAVLL